MKIKGNKMEKEYVVYKSYLVPSNVKGELPDVVYRYLADSLHNPSITKKLKNAYKIYDLDEAKETAYILGMDVGLLELKLTKI
jgi:hypothetical protein